MVDTSTINLQMNLAIHEFNRSTIGFDDITIQNPLNVKTQQYLICSDVENVGDGGAPRICRHFLMKMSMERWLRIYSLIQ